MELAFFIWLCSLDGDAFRAFVWAPDTGSYVEIALAIVNKGELIPSPRTLGYPLFLVPGYLIGGSEYGPHVAIAFQFLINLVLCFGCWKLLQKTTPNVTPNFRAAVTILLFWAGLGMAMNVLSDFLAGFFFAVFLYGMLFWRSSLSVFVSAASLAAATLIRPTFTFLPLLIPPAAYFIGRFTSRVPLAHMAMFVLFSIAATAISISYQYRFLGYAGPSDVVTKNIVRTLHFINNDRPHVDYDGYSKKLAERAGSPSGKLSSTEQEIQATQLFLEELRSRPGLVVLQLLKTFAKYLFVPVETMILKFVGFYFDQSFYSAYVRPILTLLWLPVWLFALIPPLKSTRNELAYYFLVMVFLFYLAGLTAINPLQGERVRFPILPFMIPLFVLNLQAFLGRYAVVRIPAPSSRVL